MSQEMQHICTFFHTSEETGQRDTAGDGDDGNPGESHLIHTAKQHSYLSFIKKSYCSFFLSLEGVHEGHLENWTTKANCSKLDSIITFLPYGYTFRHAA